MVPRACAESRVAAVLGSEAAWGEAFQGVPFPKPHYLLVFVGNTEEEELRAAAAAASCGFQRSMVLEGGLQLLAAGGAQPQADLRFINRDALAVLLGMCAEAGVVHAPPAALIDVRRSDERALYGAIKGAAHIPGGAGGAGWHGGVKEAGGTGGSVDSHPTLPAPPLPGPPAALPLLQWTRCPTRWRCLPTSSWSGTASPSQPRTTSSSSHVNAREGRVCVCDRAVVVAVGNRRALGLSLAALGPPFTPICAAPPPAASRPARVQAAPTRGRGGLPS